MTGRRFLGSILVFAGIVAVQSTGGSSELLNRHHRSARDPRLTANELKEVLSVHNYVRTLEGSSDMQTLVSSTLKSRPLSYWKFSASLVGNVESYCGGFHTS